MFVFETEELWSKLKKEKKPIVLYGMGNGAEKVISALEKHGLTVSGVFASDGFVRGHSFLGMKVMTYAETVERFGDFTVLISFGSSLPDVMANMKRIAEMRETYAPDVPVAGDDLFTADFYEKNKKSIDAARNVFCDEYSVLCYDELIKYKIDGHISHFKIDTPKNDALSSILSGNYSAYIDLGAYNGDTVKEAVSYFPTIKKITALEPSPRIFKKLRANTENIDAEISLFQLAAWSKSGSASFVDGAGRNSQIKNENRIQAHDSHVEGVELAAVDDICSYKNEKLLIKIDTEGSEAAALDGMKRIINENDCDFILSAYHRSEDIFSLPIKMKKMMPNSKIYLRKHPYIPAWDINLYITK